MCVKEHTEICHLGRAYISWHVDRVTRGYRRSSRRQMGATISYRLSRPCTIYRIILVGRFAVLIDEYRYQLCLALWCEVVIACGAGMGVAKRQLFGGGDSKGKG